MSHGALLWVFILDGWFSFYKGPLEPLGDKYPMALEMFKILTGWSKARETTLQAHTNCCET